MLALLEKAGRALASRTWQRAGCRSEAEARSWWVASARRRVGCAVTRAFARYRLRRLPFVGVPRAVLDARVRRGQAGFRAGAAADGGHAFDAELRGLYGFQVHARPDAD